MTVVDREVFRRVLSEVAAVIPRRSFHPIYSTVRVVVDGDAIVLTAAGVGVGAVGRLPCKGESGWGVCAPARVLVALFDVFPGQEVVMEPGGAVVLAMRSGNVEASVRGYPPDEFPEVPRLPDEATVSIPTERLADAVGRVHFAAAGTDARPILTGIAMRVVDGRLLMFAADGFRLARYEANLGGGGPFDAVVPAAMMRSVASACRSREGETVGIALVDGWAYFRFSDLVYFTKTVEGDPPDYDQVIPPKGTERTTVIVSADQLSRAVRVALSVAYDLPMIRLRITRDGVTVLAQGVLTGDSTTHVAADVSGDDMDVALNGHYLDQAIAGWDGNVRMRLVDPFHPVVIHVGDSTTHVIMPMRYDDGDEGEPDGQDAAVG